MKAAETADTTSASVENMDMLEIKFQTAQTKEINDGEEMYLMRFVTSVDSLDYSKVGFEVTDANGNEMSNETQTVYERIDSSDNSVTYLFGPKVVDTSSKYLVTARMWAVPGMEYTVNAYVKTLEGDIVRGNYRCVEAEDGLATTETINMSFEAASVEAYTVGEEDISVSYGNAGTAKADVIGINGTTVHVRVKDVDVDTLSSATVFTFGVNESTIYRNLYTTHKTSEGTPNADTSWYEVYDALGKDEFVIATTADLYGFAELVTDGTFGNQTAYLCADLTINTNTPTTDPQLVSSWNSYTPQYSWTPAGTSTVRFAGKLDGEGHSISGVYVSSTSNSIGLFGALDTGAIVVNLKMLNSYVSGGNQVGSIAGNSFGNLADVESNTVVCGKQSVGGLVGCISENSEQVKFTECIYSGSVSATGINVAGIVGYIKTASVAIDGCTMNGNVKSTVATAHSTNASVGGMVGYIELTSTLDVKGSTFTGSVSGGATYSGKNMGGIVGRVNGSSVTLDEIYVGGQINASQMAGGLIGSVESYSTADSNIAITDCHMNAIVATSTTGHQNAGGLVGYVYASKTTPCISITVSRCLVTGQLSFVEGTDYGCILIGKIRNYAKFECIGATYYINDEGYHTAKTVEGEYVTGKAWSDSSNPWKGMLNTELAEGLLQSQISGAVAITNAPGLSIDAEGSAWVSTSGFPMLRIFADN